MVDFSTQLEKKRRQSELRCEIDHTRLKVLYIVFRELSDGISGFGFK